MNYYKTPELLIQHNPITGVYRIRNTIKKGDKTISKQAFDLLDALQIKKRHFCELLNNYFRNQRQEWEFEGEKFQKLENFDKEGNSGNLTLADIPSHKITHYVCIMVYHWGEVYFFRPTQFPKGLLFDVKNQKLLRWVDIKNVAPIFNKTKKCVI